MRNKTTKTDYLKQSSKNQPNVIEEAFQMIIDKKLESKRDNEKSKSKETSNSEDNKSVHPYASRVNYFKYQRVKPLLISMLKTGTYKANDIAKEAKIAPNSTLYKYQQMAQLETGLILATQEQMSYLKQKCSPENMAAFEVKLESQNERNSSSDIANGSQK